MGKPADGVDAPSAQVPRDEREERELVRSRLGLVAKVVFGLGGGFYLFQNTIAVVVLDRGFDSLFLHGNQFHLFAISLALATYLTSRHIPAASRWLLALDYVALPAITAAFTLGMANASVELRPDLATAPQLGASLVVISMATLRATLVPSQPRRTLVVSALFGIGPLLVAAFSETAPGVPGLRIASALGWVAVAVTIATLASHVIYGLRSYAARAARLGQYSLIERVGEGGMGQVFRAEHALLRRPTAIKLLRPDRMDEAAIERFEAEVQLTATLTHPNTVTIYDYGRTDDGVFYYAMEFLEGLDLEHLVKMAGPLPPSRVVHVLMQVAGSLGEAHGRGLVHRDIKPGNLMMTFQEDRGDVVKVLDFGLVKSFVKEEPGTQENVILGTPHYLAPESIRGDRVDGRADIYALGAVAWFLLTGETVFSGRTGVEVCAAHLHRPAQRPSERLGKELPQDLEDLVLECLAKDPDERPGSAHALAARLAACRTRKWTREDAVAFWRKAARTSAPLTPLGRGDADSAVQVALAGRDPKRAPAGRDTVSLRRRG